MTLTIAHRGYSAKFPENSLIAFEEAIQLQADMIELDIHLSSDNELVVVHDYQLGRTVEGSKTVAEITAKELCSKSCGSWWKGEDYSDQKVPTLEQAFDVIKDKVLLNIEIKHESFLYGGKSYELCATRLLELLSKHKLHESILVSSFDPGILKFIRTSDKTLKLGFLDYKSDEGLRLDEALSLNCYSYHPDFEKINAIDVQSIKEKGLKVFPYTANSIESFQTLCQWGVEGIITNELELLKEFLKK